MVGTRTRCLYMLFALLWVELEFSAQFCSFTSPTLRSVDNWYPAPKSGGGQQTGPKIQQLVDRDTETAISSGRARRQAGIQASILAE
jgi:hypothetical protein